MRVKIFSQGEKGRTGGTVQAKLVEETNGGRGDRISYPFVLEPRGQIAYFDKREQVNIVAMIIVGVPRLTPARLACPSLLLQLTLSGSVHHAAQPHGVDDGLHGADGLGDAQDDGGYGSRGAQEDAGRDG